METCENCGGTIGDLETPNIWQDKIVCGNCDIKLRTGEIQYATPVAMPGGYLKGKMKPKWIAVAACALGAIGTFLPWATVPILGSIPGTAGDGWFTLGAFLVTGAIAFFSPTEELLGTRRITITILGSATAAFVIYKMIGMWSIGSDVPMDNPFARAMTSSISVGSGLYLIAIMGIVVALSGWFTRFVK